MLEADDVALDIAADLALVREAAREAAAIALAHFQNDPQVWLKSGDSPVSAADIAVDAYLREHLLSARPDYGWLSEETADTHERLSARRTFVVDPIDGTRAFIEGKPTWCISIAIVEAGEPLVGVLDCPVKDEIFEASKDRPALLNGQPISVRQPGRPPLIAAPKAMLRRIPPHVVHEAYPQYIPSLAYRIAMVAKGELDGTLVKPNSHDWDLAAADLILRRAGGGVIQPDETPPLYAGQDVRRGVLAAGSGPLLAELSRIIADI